MLIFLNYIMFNKHMRNNYVFAFYTSNIHNVHHRGPQNRSVSWWGVFIYIIFKST